MGSKDWYPVGQAEREGKKKDMEKKGWVSDPGAKVHCCGARVETLPESSDIMHGLAVNWPGS